jgi:hypothetical protein
MSLEFDVDFNKPQMQVEIQLPIPVHCNQQEMVLEVVANPAQKMAEFGDLFVDTHVDEDLISSSAPNSQESSIYRWIIDGDTTLKMVYSNSSYDKNPYGIIFTSVFVTIALLIILPVILLIIVILSSIFIFRLIRSRKKQKYNRGY